MAKIMSMRLDGKTSTGERWQVETDGLGNVEVEVPISKRLDGMKNPEKRDEKVRALVLKAAEPRIAELVANH